MRIAWLLFQIIFILIFGSSYNAFCQVPSKLNELEQLLRQARKSKDNGKIAFYSYEIAKYYEHEKQPEKSLDYLLESVAYCKNAEDNMLLYMGYQRIGSLYKESKNYNKAFDYFQKSLKTARELNRPEFITESLINISIIHATLGRHKKSIEPLDEALSIALLHNDILLQKKCYQLLSDYTAKLGNHQKSKEYTNLYNLIVESQQQKEQSVQQLQRLKQQMKKTDTEKRTAHAQLSEQAEKLHQAEDSLLATKYSLEEAAQSLKEANEISEKRQMQIDLLNKDKQLADMRIKEQHAKLENEALIRNAFIAGGGLALALMIVVIISYRRQVVANKKIDMQNKSIKSSINYAKRIQEAMLPKPAMQKKLIPDSFVLFKPRDSVSGDFYWFSEIKSWYNPDVVFVAADCTGHGVPGAFMSMIGINALNGIITRGIAESDQILTALDSEIRTALQQELTGNNDGMDVALCIYRKEKGLLEFSGAKNPLVYIQHNELFQVKGDIHSIGGSKRKNQFSFKRHIINIDQPTMIYLFSDGFRDQFGGPKNMKFMSKQFNQLLFSIHQKPLAEQCEILEKTLATWKGRNEQTDDILVLGLRLDAGLV